MNGWRSGLNVVEGLVPVSPCRGAGRSGANKGPRDMLGHVVRFVQYLLEQMSARVRIGQKISGVSWKLTPL
jgi:hypothetical protein